MKVWVVFTEREWDWQTHRVIHSVHASEKSAMDLCSQLGRHCYDEEFEVVGTSAAAETQGKEP